MLSRLFPPQADNRFPGHWLVAVCLGLALSVRALMGTNTLLNTRNVIESADRLPLSAWPEAAQATLVFSFQAWAVGLLLLVILGVLAIWRYRALIPALLVILAAEMLARRFLLLSSTPLERNAPPDPWITAAIQGGMWGPVLAGLAIALFWPRRA